MRDPDYNLPIANTYIQALQNIFPDPPVAQKTSIHRVRDNGDEPDPRDAMANIEQKAIEALNSDNISMEKIRSEGMPWGGLKAFFLKCLPPHLYDRDDFAYNLVRKAMDTLFGPQRETWETYQHPSTGKTWVRIIRK